MNLASAGDSEFIGQVRKMVLDHLEEETFGVDQLVRLSGLSHFVLRHRVKSITKKTVSQFIAEIRLTRAHEMLLSEAATASEVAYRVGFGSPAYFNKCYHEFFGYTPGESRKMAHREMDELELEKPHDPPSQGMPPESGRAQKKFAHVWRIMLLGGLITVVLLVFIFLVFPPNPANPLSGESFKGQGILNRTWRLGRQSVKTVNRSPKKEKSLAVLPFINDSPDSANVFFINGIMEGILDNLQKIKDLRVVSRTSVESFRNNKKLTLPQIARKLDVHYIVEGSGQKAGDQVLLNIQLVDAHTDKPLFSERYVRHWEDIFALQAEIATLVAHRIQAVITPEEVGQISARPTSSLAAYNMVLRGVELVQMAADESNPYLEHQGEMLFRKAIALDSTFARPYEHLAWRCFAREDYDSALYFARRCIHFDSGYYQGYSTQAYILKESGKTAEAEEVLRQVLLMDPDNHSAYRFLAELYFSKGDFSLSVESGLKSLGSAPDPYLRSNDLRSMSQDLSSLGFHDAALQLSRELIDFNNDSTFYFQALVMAEMARGEYTTAYANAMILLSQHPSRIWRGWWTMSFALTRDPAMALPFVEKYYGMYTSGEGQVYPTFDKGMPSPRYYMGYVYLKNGRTEEAKWHFEGAANRELALIRQDSTGRNGQVYLTLASIYSAWGKKEKATLFLKKAHAYRDALVITPFMMDQLKTHPMFALLRQEPELAEIIRVTENKITPQCRKISRLLKESMIVQ